MDVQDMKMLLMETQKMLENLTVLDTFASGFEDKVKLMGDDTYHEETFKNLEGVSKKLLDKTDVDQHDYLMQIIAFNIMMDTTVKKMASALASYTNALQMAKEYEATDYIALARSKYYNEIINNSDDDDSDSDGI